MAFAVAAFVVALGVIASERVDRTKVALAAMVAVLLTGTIGQEEAIAAIDWNTLGLLAGMMIMVKITEPTGVYAWLAIRAGQLSRGRPFAVLLALTATTAVLSAFLDNLTTILLVVPITFLLADALDIDPIPLVIAEVLVSNIGGTATLIGDPPNILIAGATDLSFIGIHRQPRADRRRDVPRGRPRALPHISRAVCRSTPRPVRACWSWTRAARSRTRPSCGARCRSWSPRSSRSSPIRRCTWSPRRSRWRARR